MPPQKAINLILSTGQNPRNQSR